jgi:two-component system, chemotaxis family, CheB/CheR fusion protein
MALAGVKAAGKYLDLLLRDAEERDQLSKDLLINVTGFFRNAAVFDLLAKSVIPDLVRDHPPDRPLRIWVAGCSSGEETYSLAMLFREQINASKRDVKLQIFASDVDPDAVASAREGLYPDLIKADVSTKRLAKFFAKEDRFYRISAELRSSVVFSVHDVLADPPFARLDFVSCRNLLIYLLPEAQAKVISIIHFALREGGLLLVGEAETVGVADGRFAVISKPERIYRRVGGARPGDFGLSSSAGDGFRLRARPDPAAPSRQIELAEFCRRMVLEAYGPAAVLINRKLECLYFHGPIDRYLKVVSGRPVNDVIAMAREGVRTKLRSAVQRALHENARVVMSDCRTKGGVGSSSFSIVVIPTPRDREDLLLVCFVEEPEPQVGRNGSMAPADVPRVVELERELEATKTELQSAFRNLEISSEEQMAINEEALSVNEEYQSTNEELLASKEELQSFNEELNALNSQLQETLERQRTTADDLQNVLYSTKVATIFLDTRFRIRFFTPATRALFNVIPSDVGRPLADLHSLAADDALLKDVKTVLGNQTPAEREIRGQSGAWFVRRIMPYRASDEKAEGVVITYEDVTERRSTAEALSAAKRQAELASVAKSRFLAAASHDLRQPLQTLALLQGLLAKKVIGEKAQKLVGKIDEALSAMTGMLNTLLDINQIEAGSVKPEKADFPVNDLFDSLRDELTYHAQAAGLALRVVPCSWSIRSDLRLLEQMIRNLISNALKYTHSGKVLVGCRCRQGNLRIEIWDTGIGIPESELKAIFEEYHQVDNVARQRSRGLGLGLSIVKSLGELLGHPISVRSLQGKGSMFSIEVPLTASGVPSAPGYRSRPTDDAPAPTAQRTGAILVIEDDPEVREHLKLFLIEEGYAISTAVDGPAALEAVAQGTTRPDLVLADYNLPNGMNGVQVSQKLRQELDRETPFIILTGDILTETLRDIAVHDCVHLNKPVKFGELTYTIEKLLTRPPKPHVEPPRKAPAALSVSGSARVIVVDDDNLVREAMRAVLEDDGRVVETYPSCEAFLEGFHFEKPACLLIDAYLPAMSGLELLEKLHHDGQTLPAIMITGNADVPMAIKAMKAGALDFIEKPIGREELLASIERALELSHDSEKLLEWRATAVGHLAGLTPRQRDVMERVLAGQPSKNIAADLGISQRTVENHRAGIMKRTGSKSLPALARLALLATGGAEEHQGER